MRITFSGYEGSESFSPSVLQFFGAKRLKAEDRAPKRPRAKGALVERPFFYVRPVLRDYGKLCCDAAGFDSLQFCLEDVEHPRKACQIHELADVRLQAIPGNVSPYCMRRFNA